MAEREQEMCCPYCGRTNELHSGMSPEDLPAAGDISICWKCRRAAVYADGASGLTVRKPTVEEQAEIDADPQIKRALAAITESYTPSSAIGLWRGDGRG